MERNRLPEDYQSHFYRTLMSLGIPILLQSLISYGVQLADTVMLGRLGDIALSGVSLANSFFALYHIMVMGLCQGGVVIIAQYWGKREVEPIRNTASLLYAFTVVCAVLFSALCISFPKQIMSIYTNNEAIQIRGAEYMQVLAYGYLFAGLATASTSILRAVGKVKIPLYTSIGSFFINVGLNYIFIFGKLGMPRMEMRGAALATVIARLFEFAVIGGYLFLKDDRISYRFKHLLVFDKQIFVRYLKIGLPVLITDIVMSLGQNMIAIIIGHIGSSYTAANSIVNTVNHMITIFSQALSASSAIVIGNLIGAGGKSIAFDKGKSLLRVGIAIGIIGGIAMFFIKSPIISLFNVTETAVRNASQMLTVVSFLLIFQCMEALLTKGVLRGGGDTKFLIFGDTVFTWVAALPLGYLSAFVFHFPVWAIFLCLKTDQILKTFLCLWRFFSKRWIRDVTVKLEDLSAQVNPEEQEALPE